LQFGRQSETEFQPETAFLIAMACSFELKAASAKMALKEDMGDAALQHTLQHTSLCVSMCVSLLSSSLPLGLLDLTLIPLLAP